MTLAEMGDALEKLSRQVDEIHAATVSKCLTVAQISERFLGGKSADSIRRQPWMLPNNSTPDIPGKSPLWYASTCDDWYSRPLELHEGRYLARRRME